jgi:hypothetical protein
MPSSSASAVFTGSPVCGIDFGLPAGMDRLPVDRKVAVRRHVLTLRLNRRRLTSGRACFVNRPGLLCDVRQGSVNGILRVPAGSRCLLVTEPWVVAMCRHPF